MAAEEPKKDGEQAPAKKKGSKLPIIIAVLMIAEAAGVYFIVGMINKKPAAADATTLHHGEESTKEEFVEIPLIEDHFQNMQTGRVWVWDASITIRVRKRHEEKVNGLLQKRIAEIHEGIATIFRRATAAQLKEPGLETINRQLTAYLDEVFGKDTTGEEPVSHVERVLIPRCRGFPAE
jgi:flagellar basal body-associated protein FliL